MSLGIELVGDFAVIMVVAGAMTFLAHRLKQPLILGYLIAGVIIGPHTPPFSLINRFDVLEATAGLGIILLLFAVGLEFPMGKLRKVGLTVYIGISAIEIVLMFLVSYAGGHNSALEFQRCAVPGSGFSEQQYGDHRQSTTRHGKTRGSFFFVDDGHPGSRRPDRRSDAIGHDIGFRGKLFVTDRYLVDPW